MRRKLLDCGVHASERADEEGYGYVVVIPFLEGRKVATLYYNYRINRTSIPKSYSRKGLRVLDRWLSRNVGRKDFLTPSANYLDSAHEPVWVIYVKTLSQATTVYMMFGEGV